MSSFEKRARWLALAVLLCCLLVWLILDRTRRDGTSDHSQRRKLPASATVHRSSATPRLSPIRSAAVEPPLVWGQRRPEYEPLLRDAKPVIPRKLEDMHLFELGPLPRWVIPFGLTGEDGRRLAECVNEFEPQLTGPCQWQTQYVIERIGDSDVASLEYIGVTPIERNTEPSCVALASCSASVWARQIDIPMPQELGDTYAFREFGRGSRWSSAKGDRRAFYEQALAEAMQMLEHFESMSDEDFEDMLEDPLERYNLEWARREVEDYQAILDGMQSDAGP